jgi:coenzyme F420-reducing hydrogenase beta subunit
VVQNTVGATIYNRYVFVQVCDIPTCVVLEVLSKRSSKRGRLVSFLVHIETKVVDLEDISPCPFCKNNGHNFADIAFGGDGNSVAFQLVSWKDRWSYASAIQCGYCKAMGPEVLNIDYHDACKAWNRRCRSDDEIAKIDKKRREVKQKQELEKMNLEEVI